MSHPNTSEGCFDNCWGALILYAYIVCDLIPMPSNPTPQKQSKIGAVLSQNPALRVGVLLDFNDNPMGEEGFDVSPININHLANKDGKDDNILQNLVKPLGLQERTEETAYSSIAKQQARTILQNARKQKNGFWANYLDEWKHAFKKVDKNNKPQMLGVIGSLGAVALSSPIVAGVTVLGVAVVTMATTLHQMRKEQNEENKQVAWAQEELGESVHGVAFGPQMMNTYALLQHRNQKPSPTPVPKDTGPSLG